MYRFPISLNGLKSVFSNYIENDGDVNISGNLNVSGTINTPITNLLSVSVNQNSNSINQLSISSATTNNKLELYETLNINNFNLLGTTTLNLDINQNNSNLLQGIQNNLLQNQINVIILAVSYAGSVDALYGVSIINQDSKVGLQLGITNPNLDNRIINLTTTSILNNQEFQSFKLSTTSNLNTLNTFKTDYLNISGINVDNKLVNVDENIDSLYNICNDLGSTQNDLDIKLDNNLVVIGISCSNNDIEINNVKSFLQGEIDGKVDSTDFTTLEGIVGGIGTAQSAIDSAQTAYNFANEAWKANQDINNSYQSLQIDGVDDRLDDHDGQLEILTTFKNDNEELQRHNF